MKKLIATGLTAIFFFTVAHTVSADCVVCSQRSDNSCVNASASDGCRINDGGRCQATGVRCGGGGGYDFCEDHYCPDQQIASGFDVDPWSFWA